MTDDRLINELRQLDPVEPGRLDDAARSDDAAALLERILSSDPEPGTPAQLEHPLSVPVRDKPAGRWRLTPPRLAAASLGVLVAVAAGLALLLSGPSHDGGGGGTGDRLTVALDRAGAAAASRPTVPVDRPYVYLKTREMSVRTAGAEQRSWKVVQPSTREEWVTQGGAGRMRVIAGRSRFVGAQDRAEWVRAGKPDFLPLGFGPRTEVHWVDDGRAQDLPTDPPALTRRLRDEVRADHGELPVAAAILQLIAEDLRDPATSSELRHALFEATKRLPGIRYLGAKTDPEGRRGIAVGIPDPQADTSTWNLLIFDPDTGKALATETVSQGPFGAVDSEGTVLLRATVFLEGRAARSYLVYRIPGEATAL